MTRRDAAFLIVIASLILAQVLPWLPGLGVGVSSPFGVPEFTTLIVEESSKRGELPREQLAIILGSKMGTVREYCEKRGQFRIFDMNPEADLSKVEPYWQRGVDAAKAANLTPPYMVSGATGRRYVGPLPKDNAAALAILKPIGGQ